ncbi:MAG: hypothetical protein AAF802_07605 [Planctomycetota bacterium]
MSRGTVLVYRNVILRDCETEVFDQEVVYDESGTDVMFSRFRIRVVSTVVAIAEAGSRFSDERSMQIGLIEGNVGGAAPEQLRNIQQRLSESRKDFYYFIDSVTATQNNQPDLETENGVGAIADPPDENPQLPNPQSRGVELAPQYLLVAAGYTRRYEIEPTSNPDSGGGSQQGSENENTAGTYTKFQLDPFGNGEQTKVEAWRVMDCDNGPKPKDVSVQRIFGGRTMRVSFEIEVCRQLCDETKGDEPEGISAGELQGSGRAIISNRWSLTESRDESWAVTRTLEGTLRVASKEFNPHRLRNFVVPRLPRNFRRVNQTFVVDPTGLTLKYTIQDKQADQAPPPPAIDWKRHYAELGTGAGAAQQFSELTVQLTGPPNVNKQDLIAAAGHVVLSRINGLQLTEKQVDGQLVRIKNRPILTDAAVVEVLGQPTIEMRVRVKSTASDTKLMTRIANMGAPIGAPPNNDIGTYHPDVWQTPAAIEPGTLPAYFACYLQEPCSIWHGVPEPAFGQENLSLFGREVKVENPGDENLDGDVSEDEDKSLRDERLAARPDVTLYQSNEPFPDDTTGIASSQFTEEPYTFYEIYSAYDIDTGYTQMALAQAGVVTKEIEGESGSMTVRQPTCHLMRLHGGKCQRKIHIEATRQDRMPELPQLPEQVIHPPTNAGIREVLESKKVGFMNPEFSGDGFARLFRVTLDAVYLLDRPPQDDELFRVPMLPFDNSFDRATTIPVNEVLSSTTMDWQPGDER